MARSGGKMMHSRMRIRDAIPSRRTALAIAVSAVLGGSQGVSGQGLEEIVVTATKREANLQEIPMSVTAFTSDDISKRGFKAFDDYAKHIPGLAIARREPSGSSIVFRGVAASGIQFASNPSSGIYLDEQPITAAGFNPDPRLIDIERLEALSGPQGTLFGDASQSGTLRIITNKPDADQLEGWIDGSASFVDGGDGGYDVSGMANIPLIEGELALRIVGFHSEEAGYVDNVLGTSPGGTFNNLDVVASNVNTTTYYGGRVGLRWTPNDDWTVDATAVFQDVQAEGFGDTDFNRGNALEQVRFQDEQQDENWYQLALTVEANLGFADVLVTGSVFDREVRYDADATDYQFAFQQIHDNTEAYYNAAFATVGYNYINFYDFGGDPRGLATEDVTKNKRWTIEGRIATPADSDSRWQGLVGVFYNKTKSNTLFTSDNTGFGVSPAFYYLNYNGASINGLPPGSFAPTDNWFFGAYDQDIDNLAIFGEVSFDVTENLKITAGGRWFRVERDTTTFLGGLMQSTSPDPLTDFVTTNDSATETENDWVPKVNVTYNIDDDKLVYFTYSEGFRSGGANALRPNSIIPRQFSSDFLTNYEFGAKTTWLDGRLRLNVTGYIMDWNDIQIQVNDPQPTVFQLGIVNFPAAEITGVEVAFAAALIEGWDISGSFAYNDAEIAQDAELFPGVGAPVMASAGAPLPITPDWKASVGVEYTFPTQFLTATPYARFDFTHQGESINALTGLEATVVSPPPTIQEEYQSGNFRVGLETDRWTASLFINNIWDARGRDFVNNRWAKRRSTVSQPRTFGVNVRRRF